jgi:hypothetical protein
MEGSEDAIGGRLPKTCAMIAKSAVVILGFVEALDEEDEFEGFEDGETSDSGFGKAS